MINQRILTKLTEEQRALLEQVKQEWIASTRSFERDPDTAFIVGFFHRLYRAAGMKIPNVHIFEGPRLMETFLHDQPSRPHGVIGLVEILTQAIERDFYRRAGLSKRHDDEFFFCFARSGFWRAQMYPKEVFVCLAPKVIRTGKYEIIRFRDGSESIFNSDRRLLHGRAESFKGVSW